MPLNEDFGIGLTCGCELLICETNSGTLVVKLTGCVEHFQKIPLSDALARMLVQLFMRVTKSGGS